MTSVPDGGYFRYASYNSSKTFLGRAAVSDSEYLWGAALGVSFIRISYPTDSNPKFQMVAKASSLTTSHINIKNDLIEMPGGLCPQAVQISAEDSINSFIDFGGDLYPKVRRCIWE